MRKASVTIYWDRQGDPEGWAYEAFDAFIAEVPSWYAEEDLPAYEEFRSLTHDGPGWEARGAK